MMESCGVISPADAPGERMRSACTFPRSRSLFAGILR
jgi:hypothetical protein